MAYKLLKYLEQIGLTPEVEGEFFSGPKKLCFKWEDLNEFLKKKLPVNMLSYES